MKKLKQSPKALNETVASLRNGGVVICPTDTVYGFLADAQNKKAVDKIFKIKKRSKSKPLPVFVKNLSEADRIAFIDKDQAKILKKFWPGKYTFVLKRKPNVKIYGVDKETIAIRIPKYKFLSDLLRKIGLPLVQTSVNISGQETLKKIKDVVEKFNGDRGVNLVIDGGNLPKSRPSRIIDLTKNKAKVLR